MATVAYTTSSSAIDIGAIAGIVWHTLDQNGPMSLAKLAKEVDETRDAVNLGIGWLAREDKISIEQSNRGRIVSLI